MTNKNLFSITAVTKVTASGQKCVEAVIEYEKSIKQESVELESYAVLNRTITNIVAVKNKIYLELDINDETADMYHPGNPWSKEPATLEKAKVSVKQTKDIYAIDGTVYEKWEKFEESESAKDEIVDRFIQGTFHNQRYNLYIPKNYDPAKKYPLIQFIHDASVCGEETKLTLAQGIGALIWAKEEEQEKHPCFIFAPQFEGPAIVDDDWNVDKRLEDAKEALDHIIESYSVDQNRIYTTGQSMGCMSSIVLNIRYPSLFAGSLLVAGQWNERAIPGLEKQNLWMICSQGDMKAFPIMNQMCVAMERAGAKVERQVIMNHQPQEYYHEIAKEILSHHPNIIFTPYKLETVADGWHSDGGAHHMSTWKNAYEIEALRDWLFEQERRS
ncbi:MAG: hypothetical protein E7282_00630 [Lachnospiraceae bacterium]|nr:hypothetical protein [Lachnospiraceae bacterium]